MSLPTHNNDIKNVPFVPLSKMKRTIKEYNQQESQEGIKYEYHDGYITALAGGTLNHGLLCGNIYAELRSALNKKKSNCKAFTSEIKLHIETQNSFVYPDSMVICGAIEKAESNENAVTNPILIAEVLSKSTADYDRGDKFFLYRQIPSLQEYVLIEQDKYVVDIYYKKPQTDLWQINRVEGEDKTIYFQSLDITISLKDLYFDLEV